MYVLHVALHSLHDLCSLPPDSGLLAELGPAPVVRVAGHLLQPGTLTSTRWTMQAKPTSQFSLLTPQPPSLLPSAPEPEEWQQSEATAADAIQHAWSGNPFMDFKLSGGLASTQSAHSQEPDPFSSGFAPQREASAAAAQPQAPASADARNAPMATSASHEHSFGFGDEPPAHDSAVTQQPKYGAESSHGFGAQPAHDAATDTGCFPQPGKHADEWADAMWGDTLPSHAPPQGSSPAAAPPPPPPSQQAESPGKEQAGKPAFATADAWADFGGGKSMLSLDRGAFGAPKQASGSLLSVSLPSKQSQGGAWGFEDLQPAASGRSWDDSPAGSREASPQRSLPSRWLPPLCCWTQCAAASAACRDEHSRLSAARPPLRMPMLQLCHLVG